MPKTRCMETATEDGIDLACSRRSGHDAEMAGEKAAHFDADEMRYFGWPGQLVAEIEIVGWSTPLKLPLGLPYDWSVLDQDDRKSRMDSESERFKADMIEVHVSYSRFD
jgi:hypothetical protein